MRRRGARGYTAMELIVTMSLFGMFLAILFILTAEMRRWEKRLPVNFMRNTQVSAVIARMRRDVLDMAVAGAGPYRGEHDTFKQGPKTLIFDTITPNGTVETIVWDFSEPGVVYRYAYTGEARTHQWTARGVPPEFSKEMEIDAVEFEDRPYGVRITATDANGRKAIDQILQPRSHD